MITAMKPVTDIGYAIRCLNEGMRMRRRGWNGKGMYIALHRVPGNIMAAKAEGCKYSPDLAQAFGLDPGTVIMTQPYVYMFTAQGEFVPWLCSQTDLLANDWEEAR